MSEKVSREAPKLAWSDLTSAQRQTVRECSPTPWDKLTPTQRQTLREKVSIPWDQLTSEQKRKLRARTKPKTRNRNRAAAKPVVEHNTSLSMHRSGGFDGTLNGIQVKVRPTVKRESFFGAAGWKVWVGSHRQTFEGYRDAVEYVRDVVSIETTKGLVE